MITPVLLPRFLRDLPGVGGRLKTVPEDFEVEELPAYTPIGDGEHLFVWVEKYDVAAHDLITHVAEALAVDPGDIGSAGLKDRRALTRQYLSVPRRAEARLGAVETGSIKVLGATPHPHKLRTGHLRGNRFRIRLREPHPQADVRIAPLLEALRCSGFPNYYGSQRFGRGGSTLRAGWEQLTATPRRRGRFRRLALSALQSEIFNRYLLMRLNAHGLATVLSGDVLVVTATGGPFWCEPGAVDIDQARYARREVMPTGPMFGSKMRDARHAARELEQAVLADVGLTPGAFLNAGRALPGARRPVAVWVDDLDLRIDGTHVLIECTLPSGVYATVLLRELMGDVGPRPG